jgi:hypothetical protein
MTIQRILFIHNALTSFVKIDRDILAEKYEVEELVFSSKFKLRAFALWKAVQRNDMVFIWFASWHSLLPVIFASLQKKKLFWWQGVMIQPIYRKQSMEANGIGSNGLLQNIY